MGHPKKEEESFGHLAARQQAWRKLSSKCIPDIAETSAAVYSAGNVTTEDLYQKLARLHAEQQSFTIQYEVCDRKDQDCDVDSRGSSKAASADVVPTTTQPMKVLVPQYLLQPPPPQCVPSPQRLDEDKSNQAAQPQQPGDQAHEVWSPGTDGHPDSCATACKYAKRKGGCRLGTQCPCCHRCLWRRTCEKDPPQPLEKLIKNDLSASAATVTATPAQSVGSIGHPVFCRPACKYVSKNRGCKDGPLCNRCHACQWEKKAMQAAPILAKVPCRGRTTR